MFSTTTASTTWSIRETVKILFIAACTVGEVMPSDSTSAPSLPAVGPMKNAPVMNVATAPTSPTMIHVSEKKTNGE